MSLDCSKHILETRNTFGKSSVSNPESLYIVSNEASDISIYSRCHQKLREQKCQVELHQNTCLQCGQLIPTKEDCLGSSCGGNEPELESEETSRGPDKPEPESEELD